RIPISAPASLRKLKPRTRPSWPHRAMRDRSGLRSVPRGSNTGRCATMITHDLSTTAEQAFLKYHTYALADHEIRRREGGLVEKPRRTHSPWNGVGEACSNLGHIISYPLVFVLRPMG